MMTIKSALEKRIAIFTKRPASASGTGSTKVHLSSGTRCEITEGPWRLISDQSQTSGGNGEGPDPGVLGRGALGACLAQGYAMNFARRDLTFRSIDVEIQGDIDMRGYLGMDGDIPPGYREMRYVVNIESDEDEQDILAALDYSDRHSPWLYNLTAALEVSRQVAVQPCS